MRILFFEYWTGSNTTVVLILMGGAAPTHPRFWPRPRSSAIGASANGRSDREETALAAHSTHIPSAFDAQSPRGSPADHACRVGHCASRWVRRAVRGARALRRGRLVHEQSVQRAPTARMLMGTQALACAPLGVDSDGGGPRLDDAAATATRRTPPRCSAQPAAPPARTPVGFRHSSVGRPPPLRFESAQTARPCQN